MPRLSLELRKAAIHMKEDGCSTAEIQTTLEAQGHSISKVALYELFRKFQRHGQIEDLKILCIATRYNSIYRMRSEIKY